MPERATTPVRRHVLRAAVGGVVLAGLVFGNAQAATAAPLLTPAAVPGLAVATTANDAAEEALERANDALRDADALTAEELAGALVALAEIKDAGKREAWAKRGAAFFQRRSRQSSRVADRDNGSAQKQPGGAQPASGGAGAV